ncbi:MAG: hypothetical protein AAB466_10510 [Verrucomicrobiota bacterium]
MRKRVQIVALAVAVVSLLAWALLGLNLGWTKTSVTRWQKDPVTDLEGPVIEQRFIPGIDLLGAALLGAIVLFGISFLLPAKKLPTAKYS